jgi:Carboxypeptidase regulatory-like domain
MHLFVRTFKWNIILAFAICWFGAAAYGQACGPSLLTGFVTDEAGKVVRGARVELLDKKSKEPIKGIATTTSTYGSYSLRSNGWGSMTVRVTARGFISHQETVEDFPECSRCLHVKLARVKQPQEESKTIGTHPEEQNIGQSAAAHAPAGELQQKVEDALSEGNSGLHLKQLNDAECEFQFAVTLNPAEARAHL